MTTSASIADVVLTTTAIIHSNPIHDNTQSELQQRLVINIGIGGCSKRGTTRSMRPVEPRQHVLHELVTSVHEQRASAHRLLLEPDVQERDQQSEPARSSRRNSRGVREPNRRYVVRKQQLRHTEAVQARLE